MSLLDQFAGKNPAPTKTVQKTGVIKGSLAQVIETRYLNYSMSVITSRALPDVRDGLKPVQRRVLYTMYKDLKLTSDARHRKSAAIVGFALGSYHPHGDQSVYSAMARMAQDWVLEVPMVDGYGNFGNIDGDNPASMRYTEARLRPAGESLMHEIKKQVVPFKPTFDATNEEPVVLPAPFPNLLVNGCSGIAVGMATNIPPHNPGEMIEACIDLIRNPTRKIDTLIKNHVRGPDFPTGGSIVETPEDMVKVYDQGQGSFTIRSTWEVEKSRGKSSLVITEIPYGVAKQDLIAEIAGYIVDGSIPQILDIRDESTHDVRIVLDLKRKTEIEPVLAFLFKNTKLEVKFHVNMTCLVPAEEDSSKLVPRQISLKEALTYFNTFRIEVVKRRLDYELQTLTARIMVLEGFVKVLKKAQVAIDLVTKAKSKAEAKQNLIDEFDLLDSQADTILNTKVYRFAAYEVEAFEKELADKKEEAQSFQDILDDEAKLLNLVIKELKQTKKDLNTPRHTRVEGELKSFEFDATDFIEASPTRLIVSRGGWVRRQKDYTDFTTLRVRQGDDIGWALKTNTKETAMFFTTRGRVYTMRIDDLVETSGYGDAIQALFQFEDGEEIVQVFTSDDPVWKDTQEVSSFADNGRSLRLGVEAFLEPSTVRGRVLMRIPKNTDLVAVYPGHSEDYFVTCLTRQGMGLSFSYAQIPSVKAAGKGLSAISLKKGDTLLAVGMSQGTQGGSVSVETTQGTLRQIRHTNVKQGNRGQKGGEILSRDGFCRWIQEPIEKD
jgi:DNA gyrase subunit A